MPTASRETKISNTVGLHARPAMLFVDEANKFKSRVTVYKGGEEPGEADGKSVMQMIILAATEGTPLESKPRAKTLNWRSSSSSNWLKVNLVRNEKLSFVRGPLSVVTCKEIEYNGRLTMDN